MEYLILALLILKPMTIYDMNTSFKKGLSLIYAASYGSLQNAVKKLLNSDRITFEEVVDNGRNKKIYHINQQGTEAFFSWMSSPTPAKKMETIILSKIYFLGLIKERKQQEMIVREMIEAVANAQRVLLQHKESLGQLDLPKEAITIAKYQFKTLDYGLYSHEAALKWLQEIHDELIE